MEEINKTNNSSRWNARKTEVVVGLGLLTAIVVVLQVFAVGVKLGMFNVTFVLIPIIVGAALYGWKAGAWLGFVFGLVVLVSGQAAGFMTLNPAGTIITVLLKGILAGLAAGVVYSLIAGKNTPKTDFAAVVVSGIVAPVVNTGVYILGCLLFFNVVITSGAAENGVNAWAYIFTVMIGGNFLFELGVNLVLASAVVYIIKLAKKMIKTH